MHHHGYIANVNDLPQFKNMMEQSERVEYEKKWKRKKAATTTTEATKQGKIQHEAFNTQK